MDEELQKRNTDCVYFLASPLTCKKGMECEYRHSDIARLNPRDCWYWLAGSCLNPTCAFRHPPLDGHTEASSVSAPPHSDCTEPVNKTNVPCYFYFNGFCNKGERCSFLHGHDDSTVAWKSLKRASTVADALLLEKNISTGSDTGSTLMETHPNASETVPKGAAETQIKEKQDFHQLAPNNVPEKSASPHMSASECEEAAAVRSDSLLPADNFIQSRSLVCTDQSSEEQVDGHSEREEWLESSPGFDVLVDDISENLGYEDDSEYLLALNREGRELNGQFTGHDYEDPAYPDAAILFEQDRRDSYDHLDKEHTCEYIRKFPVHSRERVFDRIFPEKRKFMPMELKFDGQRGIDLRDHLKKRKMIDGRSSSHFSRKHDSPHLTGRSRERPSRRRHLRLRSEVASENETLLNGVNQPGRLRRSHINRSRQHSKERRRGKQQFLSTEFLRKSASKKRSTEEYTMFTGPKTLDQIKEEKKAGQENGDSSFGKMGHSSRTASEDFLGPKPLSEILKDKRRLGSVIECNNDRGLQN